MSFFFDDEEQYITETEKCKIYRESLSNNKWVITNKEDLVEGNIISVVYLTNSQRDMYTYKPLIGKILKIIPTDNISNIIIMDQNNNETNIIKSGFGYGFHNESCCQMLIKLFTDKKENKKKRKNDDSLNENGNLKAKSADLKKDDLKKDDLKKDDLEKDDLEKDDLEKDDNSDYNIDSGSESDSFYKISD